MVNKEAFVKEFGKNVFIGHHAAYGNIDINVSTVYIENVRFAHCQYVHSGV